jgi:hypothetical protein
MESIEIATWTLTALTGILAASTIAYTIVTYKLFKGSNDQVEALRDLTKAILQIPKIDAEIRTRMKLQEEISKKRSEAAKNQQQKVIKGY